MVWMLVVVAELYVPTSETTARLEKGIVVRWPNLALQEDCEHAGRKIRKEKKFDTRDFSEFNHLEITCVGISDDGKRRVKVGL